MTTYLINVPIYQTRSKEIGNALIASSIRQKHVEVIKWHNVHNPGTMWYYICQLLQQVLCNIQELSTMTLPSAIAICMALHLPQIMPCSV